MKHLKSISLAFACMLFSSGFATSGETFTPLYAGLKGGLLDKASCNSLSDISLKMLYEELDYEFSVFQGPGCSASKLLFKQRLPAEAQLAGTWNQSVVIDVGSGSDSRELWLVNAKSKTTKKLAYVGEPEFLTNQIRYYKETEREAKMSDCAAHKTEFMEWKKFGFEIYLAQAYVFDATSLEASAIDKFICVAFN